MREKLLEAFKRIKRQHDNCKDMPLFQMYHEGRMDGFIEYVNTIDPTVAEELLDLKHSDL